MKLNIEGVVVNGVVLDAPLEIKFPRYLIEIDGRRLFLSKEDAGRDLDLGWSRATLFGLVLEITIIKGSPVFSIRDIEPKEMEEISHIADDSGGGMFTVEIRMGDWRIQNFR